MTDGTEGGGAANEIAPETVKRARSMGWVPKEEFKGAEERWVDADTYVTRGEEILPILKQNNRELQGRIDRSEREVNRLTTMFTAAQEAIAALQDTHTQATEAAVKKARQNLLRELRGAKESGDIDLEMRITEELVDMQVAAAEPAEKPAVAASSAAAGAEAIHPDFAAWAANNSWFGRDERKTLRAMGIAQELRSDPDNDSLIGAKFFEKVLEVMEERTSGTGGTSKTAPTRHASGGGGGSGGAKNYASLPPDAKAACLKQGKKLVGEGRAFKTEADWQAYYTKLYYGDDAA